MAQIYTVLKESTRTEDGYWKHNPCGQLLDQKRVAHPRHDSRFTMAGDGTVTYEMVPYCGHCGPVPSERGTPIMY